MCVCLYFLHINSFGITKVARRVQSSPIRGRGMAAELQPSSMMVCGELTVYVSAGPVCVHRAGGDGDEGSGQLELAGWVMNLLLQHSLKHNYTHQSQEGLSRPLELS